jgi:Family of unknown function (DUF5706)
LEELDVDTDQKTPKSDQMVEGDAQPRGWLLSLMDHVESQVAFGDTKASLLLTADSILLAAMSAVVTGERPLIDRLSAMSRTLLAMAFLALATGLLLALNTILPHRRNLWPTKIKNGELPAPSPVNFGSIAGQEEKAYVACALSRTAEELNVSLAQAIHQKSVWARRKFRRLYFATLGTTIGVVMGALAILVELISAGA